MLGSTKLVTNNSFKASLDCLQENELDLGNIDVESLELALENVSEEKRGRKKSKTKAKKKKSSMFNEDYEVDME